MTTIHFVVLSATDRQLRRLYTQHNATLHKRTDGRYGGSIKQDSLTRAFEDPNLKSNGNTYPIIKTTRRESSNE